MKFNKNRIAQLAGLPQTSQMLREAKRRIGKSSISRGKEDRYGTSDMYPYGVPGMYRDIGDSEDFGVSTAFDSGTYDGSNVYANDLEDVFSDSEGLRHPYEIDDPMNDDTLVVPVGDEIGRDTQSKYQSNLRRKMFDDDTFDTTVPAADALAFLDDVDMMNMDSFDDEGNYLEDLDFDASDDPDFPLEESEKDALNETIEIDEKALRQEVRNIRRKRINEARLKAVIEDELREVLAEMTYKFNFKR